MADDKNIAFTSFDDLKIKNRDLSPGETGRWQFVESTCKDPYLQNTPADYSHHENYLNCLKSTVISESAYGGSLGYNGSIQTQIKDGGAYLLQLRSNNSGTITINGQAFSVSGGWEINNVTLNLSNNETIFLNTNSLVIDNLRLHPIEAAMKTFSYNRFGNLTSSEDESGVATFYLYDEFHRLVTVKDQTGNPLRVNNYHYALD